MDEKFRDGADLTGFNWPLRGYAPGNYMGRCRTCGDTVMGIDKRAIECLKCALTEATKPQPRTPSRNDVLEEAALLIDLMTLGLPTDAEVKDVGSGLRAAARAMAESAAAAIRARKDQTDGKPV